MLAISNCLFARHRIVRDENHEVDQGGSIRAYFITLCIMIGIGLVACEAMSTVGIWGNTGKGQFAGEGEQLLSALAECALVVLLCRVTFIASSEKPLALCYQSSLLVLITGFALMSSRQLLVSVPGEVVNSLLVVVENYAHILFWVIVIDAARSLTSPAYRSFGIGLSSCSLTGLAWSFFLEHNVTAADSAVFVVFYLLLVVCIVYPQMFNRISMRSSSDEDAINAFALEGEQHLTPGVSSSRKRRYQAKHVQSAAAFRGHGQDPFDSYLHQTGYSFASGVACYRVRSRGIGLEILSYIACPSKHEAPSR